MPDLGVQAQVARTPPVRLADPFCERDRLNGLLQSIAAQFQGLQAGYAHVATRSRTSLPSLRDDLGYLLDEFKPSSPS